jgi:hypothetical protein
MNRPVEAAVLRRQSHPIITNVGYNVCIRHDMVCIFIADEVATNKSNSVKLTQTACQCHVRACEVTPSPNALRSSHLLTGLITISLLQNPNIHNRYHKIWLSIVFRPIHLKSLHTTPKTILILSPPMFRSSQWTLIIKLSNRNVLHISHLPDAHYMITHIISLNLTNTFVLNRSFTSF